MVLWAWIGTFNLILLMIQDYTNNRWVDDRKNWLMVGVSIGLLHIFGATWWVIILIVLVGAAMRFFLVRYNALGEADINSIFWIYLGYCFINIAFFIWFIAMFIGLYVIYFAVKKYIFKYNKPVPLYFVLLLAFGLNNILFGLY